MKSQWEIEHLASLQNLKKQVPILSAKKYLGVVPAHSFSQTPIFKIFQYFPSFRANVNLLPL